MEADESYLDDYTPYTVAVHFRVGGSDAGRGLCATEQLPRSEDLLDEVPLIAWPGQLRLLPDGARRSEKGQYDPVISSSSLG